MSHAEAREYWATHGIGEESPGDEEVEVRTSKSLSTILSLRMDSEHINRLKALAKEEGVGVTTMARMLLNRALDQPEKQSRWEAMEAWSAGTAAGDVEGFLVFPAGNAEQLTALVSQTAQKAFVEGFWKQAFLVGREDADALLKLRELSLEN